LVQFSAYPPAPVTSYDWDLNGDGTYESNTGAVSTTSFSYGLAGHYNAKVRMNLSGGGTAIGTVSVQVHGFRTTVNPGGASGIPNWTAILLVHNNPAIIYASGGLFMVRASDSEGQTWNAPVTIDSSPSSGAYFSAAL